MPEHAALALLLFACGSPETQRVIGPDPLGLGARHHDPLAGSLERPTPRDEGGVEVFPITHPDDDTPPQLIEPLRVTCDGHVPAGELQCSAERECERFSCYAPGACHGGAHPQDTLECDVGSCEDGQICVRGAGGAGCGATEQRCESDCRSAGCDAGAVCAGDGLCRPADCRWAGESCGPNAQCTEIDGWGRCQRRACQSSRECDCGACVQGRCFEQPGRCEQPRP